MACSVQIYISTGTKSSIINVYNCGGENSFHAMFPLEDNRFFIGDGIYGVESTKDDLILYIDEVGNIQFTSPVSEFKTKLPKSITQQLIEYIKLNDGRSIRPEEVEFIVDEDPQEAGKRKSRKTRRKNKNKK